METVNPRDNPKILQLLPADGWIVEADGTAYDLVAFALLEGTDGSTWVDGVFSLCGFLYLCTEFKKQEERSEARIKESMAEEYPRGAGSMFGHYEFIKRTGDVAVPFRPMQRQGIFSPLRTRCPLVPNPLPCVSPGLAKKFWSEIRKVIRVSMKSPARAGRNDEI